MAGNNDVGFDQQISSAELNRISTVYGMVEQLNESLQPRKLWLCGIVAVLLIHSTLLWRYGHWMWSREHYQYFPLILVAGCWLIWKRLPGVNWPRVQSFSTRHALYFLFSIMLLVLAVFTGSHWFGLLSCMAGLWTTTWYFGGRSAASQFRGPFLFLCLLIPLPVNLDLQCVIGLQQMASWLASGLLDLFQLRHSISGVAIRTGQKAFMVEEACSGVHSLFSAVSAITFLCIFRRYGILRILLMLLVTVLWVLAANALRVFLLVYSDLRWNLPLDAGWPHDLLGIFTYLIVILLSLSTDQLLQFIFPMFAGVLSDTQSEFQQKVIRPIGKFFTGLFDDRYLGGRAAVIVPVVLVLLAYVPLSGMAIASQFLGKSEPVHTSEAFTASLQQIQETALPEDVAGWKRMAFETVSRDRSDPFGANSAIWEYRGRGMAVGVSIDGHYSEWHDLAYCYIGSGWKIQNAENRITKDTDSDIHHTQLKLYRNAGDTALVMFSCFDGRLKPVKPPEVSGSLWRTLRNRLLSGGLMTGGESEMVPPLVQFQLFARSEHELLPHEEEALLQLFVELRTVMIDQLAVVQK